MADRKQHLKYGGGHTIREPLSPISSESASTRTPRRRKDYHGSGTPARGTPGGRKNNSCSDAAYDRYIPNRLMMDVQASQHKLLTEDLQQQENNENADQAEIMRNNLEGEAEKLGSRILQMKIKPPVCKEGELHMKTLYTKGKPTPAKLQSTRHISSNADKILDAPYIVDDYYLNLLDWGSCGIIAVPLHNTIYLWNSDTGDVKELQRPDTDDDIIVTCVKWIQEGEHLAIALSDGMVELWDASQNKRVRAMAGHPCRVGSLSWNKHLLSSGNRSGQVYNHDVRIAQHHTSSFIHHTQDICGLQWSPDGKFLASGANDNTLCIWDQASMTSTQGSEGVTEITTPLHQLLEHQAAVKAVSWCPWQRNILASGGGTADRAVKIWNVATGACLQSHDTGSQISGVLWSGQYKEIICSHGTDMTIYKYPSMTRETDLKGHTGRVLNIAMSPNGHMVASAGADETLRLWKCFEPDITKKKSAGGPTKKEHRSITATSLR